MLGDDIAFALPELRAQAESQMVDACTITRDGAPGAWDPETGTHATSMPVDVYAGKCRLRTRDVLPAHLTAAEAEYTSMSYVLSLPMPYDAPVGARVVITASALDPALVGRTYTVMAGAHMTQTTARRLVVQEVE